MRGGARDRLDELRKLQSGRDSIGVTSSDVDDEYDSYLAPTRDLLERGATTDEISDYLSYLVRDHIGLGDSGVEFSKPRDFARSLQAWFTNRTGERHRP